jgi:hypothetical protein
MYKRTVMTVCLYWGLPDEEGLVDFLMSSKLETDCSDTKCKRKVTRGDENGVVTTTADGGFVCWTKTKCEEKKKFSKAECSVSCECPLQPKGTADGTSFDKNMFTTKGDKKVVKDNPGKKIVEGLIDSNHVSGGLNKPTKGKPRPAGWEVRRWQGCVGSGTTAKPNPCPGTEGVTS